MSEIRTIKKYPNRRLYDMTVSSYVTLSDLKKLVLSREPFQVIDARNQQDLTRTTLLQLIQEEEEKGVPVFSIDVLLFAIRSHSSTQQELQACAYLTQQVKHFEHAGMETAVHHHQEDEAEAEVC